MASAVTSIYNNIISAASAGFAPTNSADVSAIASSYQVVSATATQLYAGTAYITEINGSLVSASRAGNAANASLANSAWYDGTGRLISALADSATVSAIASAYAESAASSKLDSTASSSFYPADNPSGFISSVDLSDYATTAYVDSSVSSKLDATASSQFLTSIPIDYATTAYVDSSISGFAYESAVSSWTAKQDALTFSYDTANKISSINGSALAGEGGGGIVTSLQYYTSGSTSTGSGTAIGFANAGNSTGSINYYTLDFGEHDPSCITANKYSQILITADKNADFTTALPYVSSFMSAYAIYKSVADTAADFSSIPDSAKSYVGKLSTVTHDYDTSVQYGITGTGFSSIKTGEENVLVLAYWYMYSNWNTLSLTGTTGSFVFNYGSSSGYSAISGINELGIYLDTANCYPTSNPSGFISNADLSNFATTAYVDSSVSSKLDATASSQFITSTAGLATTADISGFAYESAVSGWTAKQDQLTFEYDTANNISSIDGSAIGGQGGIDSATCSAIASAYAESAASGKLDSSASSSFYGIDNPSGFLTAAYTPTFGYNTADQISSIDGSALGGMDEAAVSGIASAYAESAVSSVSGNYYTTANESGFLTAQAQASWSESASASPSYIQDKPDLVDIVAGPGIVVDNPDGNTLRVSMAADYEVELFSGTAANTNVALSEALDNFERIKIYAYWKGTNTYDYYGYSVTEIYTSELSVGKRFTVNVFCNLNDSEFYSIANFSVASTKTQLNLVNVKRASLTEQLIAQNDGPTIYKVVGVHRIANN